MGSRFGRWPLAGLIVVLLAVSAVGLLTAGSPGRDRADALEQRLRCPVCKSVSIAQSPSATAASMRSIVEEQVSAGRSDQQILAYFQDRYGQWVLLDPPASGATLLLWVLPLVAAGGGVALLAALARGSPGDAVDLPDEDRSRVLVELDRYSRDAEQDDEP